MFKKMGLISIIITIAIILSGTFADAQKFPSKDITLIVPWSAGGGTDTIARTLAKNAKKYKSIIGTKN